MRPRLGPSVLGLVRLLTLGLASPLLLHDQGKLLADEVAAPPEHLIPLNLDYSLPGLADPTRPWGWQLRSLERAGVEVSIEPAPGEKVAADAAVARTLHLRRAEEGPPASALYPLTGLLDPGRQITVMATFTRPASSHAVARLGLQAAREDGEEVEAWSPSACAAPVEASEEDETAPADGKPCRDDLRVTLEIPEGASSGQIVLEQSGVGEATMSPLRLLVNGSVAEGGVLPGQRPPSEADVAWVRRHAVPLASTEPTGSLSDLESLDPVIGDARFVLLGESTHGSHELFTLKHRIVRWLAEERGFGVFALEDHVGAAEGIDRYVQTGEGDPAALVEPLFSIWERQEMLDLVLWMRRAVASGKARISFRGFDLQYPLDAIQGLAAFAAEHDPELAAAVETELAPMRAAWEEEWYPWRGEEEHQAWAEAAGRILERVEAAAPVHRERAGAAAAARAAFDARRIWQSAELSHSNDGTLRDRFMAENLSWIAEHQHPGSRVVVWAHDAHVWQREGALGGELAVRHPGEVVSVALLTAVGDYGAYGPERVVKAFPLFPAPVESVEYLLHRAGLPLFLLDLKPVRAAEAAPHRLRATTLRRIIGAAPVDLGFYPAELAPIFDAVLFVDRTTATRPLEAARP